MPSSCRMPIAFVCFVLATCCPVKSEPPAKTPPRLDRYGDPLPEGAIARLGTLRWRHHDDIFCLALSPDERIVASAGTYSWATLDHAVRLWDIQTGKQQRDLLGSGADSASLAFSPDGKTLASGGGHGQVAVRLWDVATGKELRLLGNRQHQILNGNNCRTQAVVFSPDCKLLASCGQDGTARLWDLTIGKELRRWSAAAPAAFSPDG